MSKNNNSTPVNALSPQLIAFLAIFLLSSLATGANPESPFGEGAHEAFVKRVNTAQAGEYQRVLAEFNAHLKRHPEDSIAAVERCQFIDTFAYSDDQTIEAAADDAEACEQGLRDGSQTESSAVKLYLWQQEWGDDQIEAGERLLKESESWTTRQRVALHESLSGRYETADALKSGVQALAAVRLDPNSHLRLTAAQHLIRIGAKRRAVEMIEAMPDEQWQLWSLQSALTTLIGLGETAAARKLVEAHAEIELDATSQLKLARAMIGAGDTEAGRALVGRLTDGSDLPEHYGPYLELELFAFQRDHGTALEASTSYRMMRDKGFRADAFGRHRLGLSFSHWTAPWRWPDLLGIGTFLLILGFAALLPLLVVAPVHYRSAVKQVRGFVPMMTSDESPWTLRSLWYALAVFLISGTVTLYVFSYPDFEAAFGTLFGVGGWHQSLSDNRDLGRAVLWGDILCVLLLLPLFRGTRVRTLLFGNWSALRSILTGVGIAIPLLIANAIVRGVVRLGSEAGVGLGTDTVRALQGIHELYGPFALLAVAALVTPIVEELVFRGVFLRALARHVRVWVAALAQAAVFVLFHEEVSQYPYLFALAMVASWLAWRSGGLLAPIALHATNNTLAALAIMGITRAVNAIP